MAAPRYVVPTPQTANTIGLLNIIFGSALLGWCLLSVSSLIMAPLMRGPSAALAESFDRMAADDHEKILQKIRDLRKESDPDSVKEVFDTRIAQLEKAGPAKPFPTDMMTAGMDIPILNAWSWIDGVTAFVTDIGLIVSGFGLILLTGWGRKLGIWVAAAKLVRLVIIWGAWIVFVVPPFSAKLGDAVEEMMRQQMAASGGGGAAMPFSFATLYAVIYSAMGVFMIFAGAIYPTISLVTLRRPGVRAACIDRPTPGPAAPSDSLAEPVG